MERDLEKDLIEIECAIKSQEEKGNIFTMSVLQRCHKLVSELQEYKALEEQGKLLKLPCKAGDTVWHISEKAEKRGRKRTAVLFVDEGIVDNITLGCAMTPQITVCSNENTWDTFGCGDIGKTVFPTKEEAEAALKEMIKKQPSR